MIDYLETNNYRRRKNPERKREYDKAYRQMIKNKKQAMDLMISEAIKYDIKIKLTFILLLLAGCLGPELFTLGGIKVTAGTAITVPHKIEAIKNSKE
jgi:hypothetical protein